MNKQNTEGKLSDTMPQSIQDQSAFYLELFRKKDCHEEDMKRMRILSEGISIQIALLLEAETKEKLEQLKELQGTGLLLK